jgi:thiol-disulfide isomerase/thioredoxin
MRFIILVIAVFILGSAGAQDLNKVVFDQKAKQNILVGECSRDGFQTDEFKSFLENNQNYEPDANTIKQIKKLRKDVEVVIVFATWCHDTQIQLPRFFRILDEAGFKEDKIMLIGVDTGKLAAGADISWLEISRVPTFVFYKNGREIGRVVEKPSTSLEKDVLMILTLGS